MTNGVRAICAYCGLPVPRAFWSRDAEACPLYCCGGCRFAARVASSTGDPSASTWMFAHLALAIFCTMNVMAFTMALWSGDIYVRESSDLENTLHGLFRYLCLFFSLPVLWLLGLPLLENAWECLRRGIPTTDFLLALGVAAAFGYSAWSVFSDSGAVYFEIACMVLVLVTLGRWLEATGKARATHALDALEKLLPETVCIVEGAAETMKPRREVQVGNTLRIRAGERIPCDSELIAGSALIDEQMLTGENAPKFAQPGSSLHAGTLNLDGDLLLHVHRAPDDGALARLVRLVRQAQDAKSRHEQIADRLSTWFLFVVAALAVAASIYHGAESGAGAGILVGLSVVLIACPCALGIATPLAVWTALAAAARHRVVFQGGDTIERLAQVRHFCFDKTGTLTTGTPSVARIHFAAGEDEDEVRRRAFTLASSSRHVFSAAIASALCEEPSASEVGGRAEHLAGRGVRMIWSSGDTVCLGSAVWMREQGIAIPAELASIDTDSRVLLAWAGCVRGVFVLTESLRPEAIEVLEQLKRDGFEITVLTGDHAVAAWWKSLSVPIHAGLLPEQKWQFVQSLRERGCVVAMVGDGVNDSPALAAGDVGIALGHGADVARDAAGVCLFDSDLRSIPWAIRLARRTVAVIRQNLCWAFLYNGIGIGLACTGRLNPVIAAVAMVASSFFVLGNSLRLRSDNVSSAESHTNTLEEPRKQS